MFNFFLEVKFLPRLLTINLSLDFYVCMAALKKNNWNICSNFWSQFIFSFSLWLHASDTLLIESRLKDLFKIWYTEVFFKALLVTRNSFNDNESRKDVFRVLGFRNFYKFLCIFNYILNFYNWIGYPRIRKPLFPIQLPKNIKF